MSKKAKAVAQDEPMDDSATDESEAEDNVLEEDQERNEENPEVRYEVCHK